MHGKVSVVRDLQRTREEIILAEKPRYKGARYKGV